jgi:Tol biopolymer transport system component
MPSIDEQLRDRIGGSAPPSASAGDLFVRLGERKRRRATARKLGTVGLVVAVLVGTVGGFVALDRAFRTGPSPAAPSPSVANGALIVSVPNGDDSHLMVLPPLAQDLDPADGTSPADRSSMDALTSEPGTRDVDASVSPDGSMVAFVRKDASAVPPGLWLIGIDGTDERPVTRAPADVKSPAWSPDGSLIAFSAADEPEGRALYTIHPDGSDLQVVVRGQDVEDIAWSPDGGSIVYSAADVHIPGGSYDLWKVAIDGTGPIDLTPSASVDETDPTWSPDGSSIAFVTPDGIREMPAAGGQGQLVVPSSPSGDGPVPTSPAWSPDGAYLTFVQEAPSASVVYLLPAGATDAFPLAAGSSFAWQPVPLTSSPTVENLGLDYPVCRVMSMPITVAGAPGDAYVFTQAAETCPKAGEGKRFVAADLNGDGVADTAPVQLHGCFPPVGCETFAAPDVNGDGTSEVAVSNAGADGYGVWLFALTTSPPAIVSIDVADPQGIGYIQTGPLEFAWVDVAGHAEGAMCETSADGTDLSIFGYDKFEKETEIRATTLHLDGTTATVTEASKDRIPLADAVVPGNDLCGASLHGSAANFPDATDASGLDIGIGEPLCDVSELHADFTGDGSNDTVWVGMPARDGHCGDLAEGTAFVAMDDTGDGLVDGSYVGLHHCMACRAYAATDLDGDGIPELIVLIQGSATPTYGIYEAIIGPNMEPSSGLVPVSMTSDAPAMGLSAGDALTVTAGGDEGYSFAIGCEGFPTSPVLVQWRSEHPIEGPGSDVRDIYMTKLRVAAETATVIDSQHATQSTNDPQPFDSLNSTGCGVRWFPPE